MGSVWDKAQDISEICWACRQALRADGQVSGLGGQRAGIGPRDCRLPAFGTLPAQLPMPPPHTCLLTFPLTMGGHYQEPGTNAKQTQQCQLQNPEPPTRDLSCAVWPTTCCDSAIPTCPLHAMQCLHTIPSLVLSSPVTTMGSTICPTPCATHTPPPAPTTHTHSPYTYPRAFLPVRTIGC